LRRPIASSRKLGLKITVASPGGVTPTVDPLSFNLAYNSNDANTVQEQQGYMNQLGSALTLPMRIEDIDPDRFAVIFLVGGHGPMQDMAVHPTIGAVLLAMLDNPKKIVAAVCHGPAGLLNRVTSGWNMGI
jgi:putative intracellular protease/amidase